MELTPQQYAEFESKNSAGIFGIPPVILTEIQKLRLSPSPHAPQNHELLPTFEHESSLPFPQYFEDRLGRATPEEFDLAQSLLGAIFRTSDRLETSPSLPRYSLIDALSLLRITHLLYGEESKPRILQLGSTTGVPAALCRLLGFQTLNVEFNQTRYFAQSHLFSSLKNVSTLPPYSLLPWWEWIQKRGSQIPSTDIVFCNEFIRELPTNLLEYLLQQMRESLTTSNPSEVRAVVCYLTKDEGFLPWRPTWEKFYAAGFKLIHLSSSYAVCIPRTQEFTAHTVSTKLSRNEYPNPLDRIVPAEHFETLLTALEAV